MIYINKTYTKNNANIDAEKKLTKKNFSFGIASIWKIGTIKNVWDKISWNKPEMVKKLMHKIVPSPAKQMLLPKVLIHLPISKLHSILAVANLLSHNNISQICYWGQISLQSAAVNYSFSDNLTSLGVTFILLAIFAMFCTHFCSYVGRRQVHVRSPSPGTVAAPYQACQEQHKHFIT